MLIPLLKRFGSALTLLASGILFTACSSEGPASTSVEQASVVSVPGAFAQSLQAKGVLKLAPVVEGCMNHPGPFITLSGELLLDGIDAQLLFANNVKLTHQHTEDVTVSVRVLEDGESIQIPKQPPLGGAGGNPFIYLQLFDQDWSAISEKVLLGRCVQGLSLTEFPLLLDAAASGAVTTGSCSNSPGPYITLTGEVALTGINGRLYFQNNAKGTHTADEDVTIDIVILPAGETITFAKQPPLGGVGGNPHIWLQFLDEEEVVLAPQLYLGRCNQMD